MPCISVIVPVYNVLPYLDRCMDSLLCQTHQDLDILLIDDGSTDGSAQKCDAYARQDARVRVIHQENAGLSAARNTGLAHAHGDFSAFADPDDYLHPRMLELLARRLTETHADVCFCRYYDVSASGTVRPAAEDYHRSVYTGPQIDELLLGMVGSGPHCPHDVEIGMSVWKGLYSLPLLRAHHIRFYSEREFLSEDLLFHLDILSRARTVAVEPEFLYYYCHNCTSLTGIYRPDRFAQEKHFYQKLSTELARRWPPETYQQRLCKAFLGRVRRCIELEFAADKNGCRSRVCAICRDPLVQAVLRDLDESQLPLPKRLLHRFIQTDRYSFLWFCFWLRSTPAPRIPWRHRPRRRRGRCGHSVFSGYLNRWPCRR